MKNYKKGIFTIIILLISSYFSVCMSSYNSNTPHILNIGLSSPTASERARQMNYAFSNSTKIIRILDITDTIEFTFESTHTGSYYFQILDENQTIVTDKSGPCVKGMNEIPFTLDPNYYKSGELYTIVISIDISTLLGFFTKYSEFAYLYVIPEETVLEIKSTEAIFWKDILNQEFTLNVTLLEKSENTPVCSQNISFYLEDENNAYDPCSRIRDEASLQSEANLTQNLKYIGSGITDSNGELVFQGERIGLPIPEFKIHAFYGGNHVWDPSQDAKVISMFSPNDYACNILNDLMKFYNYTIEAMYEYYNQVQTYFENHSTFSTMIPDSSETQIQGNEASGQIDYANPTPISEISNNSKISGSLDNGTRNTLVDVQQDCQRNCFIEVQNSMEVHLTPIIKMIHVRGNYSDTATFTANITTILGYPLKNCMVDFYIFGHTADYPTWLAKWDFLSKIFDYLWFFFYFYGGQFKTCNCCFCKLLTGLYEYIESYIWVINIGSASTNEDGIAQVTYPLFLIPANYSNVLNVDFAPLIPGLKSFAFYKLFKDSTLIEKEPTSINPIDTELRYSDSSNIIFQLTDNEGNGIPQPADINPAARKLEFYLQVDGTWRRIDEGYTEISDIHRGEVEISYIPWLTPGEYPLEVRFSGDSFYTSITYSGSVTILPEYVMIHCQNTYTGRYSDKLYPDVWITDDEGNPLPQLLDIASTNKEIHAYYSLDSTYASLGGAIADSNGHALFEYDLFINPGVYQLRFYFNGDVCYYQAYSTDSTLEIFQENTIVDFVELNEVNEPVILSSLTIKYSDPYLIQVMLQDDESNLIPQVGEVIPPTRTISVLIGSTIVCSVAVEVGGIGGTLYNPSLQPGTYTITANFNGDDWYSGNQKAINLLIEKEDTVLTLGEYSVGQGNTVELTATLTDNEGNSIAGKSINFYKESTLIGTALTSTEGKAILSYLVPDSEPVGSFTLKAEFLGDGYYNSAQTISSITILEILMEMTCPFCDGTGVQHVTTTCHMCEGTGDHHVMCSGCLGTGKRLAWVTCPTCHGNGIVQGNCWACKGSGKILGLPCIFCGGDGKVNYLCPTCLGFKVILSWVNCWDCGGDGIRDVACPVCGGIGQIEEDVPCICCTGDGLLIDQEAERIPQLDAYTQELSPILENFNSAMNNLFQIIIITIGIVGLLTLGIGPIIILSLLSIVWGSLKNNPSKIDNMLSTLVTHKDCLLSPTMGKLTELSSDLMPQYDVVGVIFVVIATILFVLYLLHVISFFWWDKAYTDIGTILAPSDPNPSKFAIIVCGGAVGGDGQGHFKTNAGNFYEVLRARGYTDDTIIYLNVEGTHMIEIGGITQNRVDGISSQQNLQKAIDWLAMYSDSSDKIVIYITDHGASLDTPGIGLFKSEVSYIKLNDGNNLWDYDLKPMLNDPDLNYGTLIYISEVCFDGGFISEISGINRIIITSTDASHYSYSLNDPPEVESMFTGFFLNKLENNWNFRDAFKYAAYWTEWTLYNDPTGPYYQYPLLDDDGNGIGHRSGVIPGEGDGLDTGLAVTISL